MLCRNSFKSGCYCFILVLWLDKISSLCKRNVHSVCSKLLQLADQDSAQLRRKSTTKNPIIIYIKVSVNQIYIYCPVTSCINLIIWQNSTIYQWCCKILKAIIQHLGTWNKSGMHTNKELSQFKVEGGRWQTSPPLASLPRSFPELAPWRNEGALLASDTTHPVPALLTSVYWLGGWSSYSFSLIYITGRLQEQTEGWEKHYFLGQGSNWSQTDPQWCNYRYFQMVL